MTEEVEPPQPAVGTRWVLPCGHRWTVPWGLPPEVVAADLLRHQSSCDLDPGAPVPAELSSLRAEGVVAEVAVRVGLPSGEPDLAAGLRSAPLSLLDLTWPAAALRSPPDPGFALIARDVFAGGALDGSLIDAGVGGRGRPGPPPTLAQLHGRLDPVLRLGSLTRSSGRSLAQAALAFALQWPWVLTAVVPFSAPERWPSLWAPNALRPLDGAELGRLGLPPGPAGSSGRPG